MIGPGARVAITVAVVAFLLFQAYQHGLEVEKGRQAQAVADSLAYQRTVVARLRDRQVEREVVYRDRIKTVYVAEDPTGCADEPIAPDILGELLQPANPRH